MAAIDTSWMPKEVEPNAKALLAGIGIAVAAVLGWNYLMAAARAEARQEIDSAIAPVSKDVAVIRTMLEDHVQYSTHTGPARPTTPGE